MSGDHPFEQNMTVGMFKVFMYEHMHEELSNEQVAKIISDATGGSELETMLSESQEHPDTERKLSYVEFCSVVYSWALTIEGRQSRANLQVGRDSPDL